MKTWFCAWLLVVVAPSNTHACIQMNTWKKAFVLDFNAMKKEDSCSNFQAETTTFWKMTYLGLDNDQKTRKLAKKEGIISPHEFLSRGSFSRKTQGESSQVLRCRTAHDCRNWKMSGKHKTNDILMGKYVYEWFSFQRLKGTKGAEVLGKCCSVCLRFYDSGVRKQQLGPACVCLLGNMSAFTVDERKLSSVNLILSLLFISFMWEIPYISLQTKHAKKLNSINHYIKQL